MKLRLPKLKLKLPKAKLPKWALSETARLKTWIAPARARFMMLAPRERLLVAVGGVFLVATLLYALLWSPMQRDLKRLRAAVPEERAKLATMRAQAQEIATLRTGGATASAASSGNLLTTIEQTAGARGLRGQITRLAPESANGAHVTFEGVGFSTLVGWLADLGRQHGVRVESANLDAQTAPGVVNARLLLRGAAL